MSKGTGGKAGGGKVPAGPKKAAAKKPRVTKAGRPAVDGEPSADGQWALRLYVAGQSPKSVTALNNLRRLCEQHIPGMYSIEVIDLLKNPQLAQVDQILAIPTLVRKIPEPMRRVIGDLSDAERTLIGLDLQQLGSDGK